jgi:hypothetical protein
VKIEVETGSRGEFGWLDKTLPQQQQQLLMLRKGYSCSEQIRYWVSIMPEKKEIGELHPNYREASKELRWAYRRLGDAEKFLTSGNVESAKNAVYDGRHAVKDALHLLGES